MINEIAGGVHGYVQFRFHASSTVCRMAGSPELSTNGLQIAAKPA